MAERYVMDLPSPKTVSLLFLIVLLALAGYSPVFGGDGASIELTPPLGCPDGSREMGVFPWWYDKENEHDDAAKSQEFALSPVVA